MSAPVIAIDGPSASGKGTIAQRVASALGYHYLESGALYRLVALSLLQRGGEPAAVAKGLDASFRDGKVFLEKQDVTEQIRSEDCGNKASEISSIQAVRSALLERQRAFRQPPGLVADGRDMGTVVFPDARLKIFLTARPEVRALRRYNQLNDKGIHANLRALSRDLEARDARDAKRAVAPLKPAPDAWELDTSELQIDAVAALILKRYREGSSR